MTPRFPVNTFPPKPAKSGHADTDRAERGKVPTLFTRKKALTHVWPPSCASQPILGSLLMLLHALADHRRSHQRSHSESDLSRLKNSVVASPGPWALTLDCFRAAGAARGGMLVCRITNHSMSNLRKLLSPQAIANHGRDSHPKATKLGKPSVNDLFPESLYKTYITSGPSKMTPTATTAEEKMNHQKYESLQFCKSALMSSSSAWTSPGDAWDRYIDQDLASDNRHTEMMVTLFKVSIHQEREEYSNESEIALRHECSLAHLAGRGRRTLFSRAMAGCASGTSGSRGRMRASVLDVPIFCFTTFAELRPETCGGGACRKVSS
jgi:hypothetical protein